MSKNNCRVCGLNVGFYPWGENERTPTYEICPCCGVEFGYEDASIQSTKKYREKWLEGNKVWFNIKEKPKDWNLVEQLKEIDPKYK